MLSTGFEFEFESDALDSRGRQVTSLFGLHFRWLNGPPTPA